MNTPTLSKTKRLWLSIFPKSPYLYPSVKQPLFRRFIRGLYWRFLKDEMYLHKDTRITVKRDYPRETYVVIISNPGWGLQEEYFFDIRINK